ncbi:MAG: hypothetical protein A2Y73_07495 [Chloroflexi bacterium RBG_13_56_8]|nr:MAG: hypothetical protein A2Y73_07495 [Chloroflexi bacterium RBG_13_56_8]
MANAFYVLNATRRLGLGIDVAGLFVSAQVTGSLMSGILMGTVQDHLGPLVHMRVVGICATLPSLLALGTEWLPGLSGHVVLYPYLLIYFFLGLSMASLGWPFFNWIMEYTEETRRPLYIGVSNTLVALTMLAPALGGWIVSTFSYSAVFLLSFTFALMALITSRRMPSTRG